MRSHPLAFTDIETTGHDPVRMVDGILVPWHEIIDIGCVLVEPRTHEVLGEFECKVKPQHLERCIPKIINNYPARAAAGEWNDALDLKDGINGLFNFLESLAGTAYFAVPGGQNFFFDWSFFTVAFALTGHSQDEVSRNYLHYSRFDTRSMAIQELREPGTPFDPNDYSVRSESLARRLGINPEPEVHTAINGARKSFEVWKKLEELKQNRFVK